MCWDAWLGEQVSVLLLSVFLLILHNVTGLWKTRQLCDIKIWWIQHVLNIAFLKQTAVYLFILRFICMHPLHAFLFSVISWTTQLCRLSLPSAWLLIVANPINTVSVRCDPVPCPPAPRLIPYPHPFFSLESVGLAALEAMWMGEALRLRQMARAALIQSHCRRMNTVSERLPERLWKTVRGRAPRAKRESDRVSPVCGRTRQPGRC